VLFLAFLEAKRIWRFAEDPETGAASTESGIRYTKGKPSKAWVPF